MGTATTAEALDSFKKVYCDLDVHKMIQISMDGPNVNWKIVEIANKHCKEQDPGAPSLLEMGNCEVHVLHGTYKTAQSVTSSKVDKFLKNCFSIFKELFPLKYCGHSWLENQEAIGRIIKILPYIKQYLKELKEKKAFSENND